MLDDAYLHYLERRLASAVLWMKHMRDHLWKSHCR